ncbi:MAG TPA: hypothetical protein VHT75_02220 [Acidimicrobiales bacterium]|jgi:hypothetical protein|nr:hypothetical protein [Acidimicrobiales bacterium]
MPLFGATSAGNDLFGGTELLRLLFLAFGGALVVGNVLALLRPPPRLPTEDQGAAPLRPPLARSVTMIAIGMVAVIWALASLTS